MRALAWVIAALSAALSIAYGFDLASRTWEYASWTDIPVAASGWAARVWPLSIVLFVSSPKTADVTRHRLVLPFWICYFVASFSFTIPDPDSWIHKMLTGCVIHLPWFGILWFFFARALSRQQPPQNHT